MEYIKGKILKRKRVGLVFLVMLLSFLGLYAGTYLKVKSLVQKAGGEQQDGFAIYLLLLYLVAFVIIFTVFLVVYTKSYQGFEQVMSALKQVVTGNSENRVLIEKSEFSGYIDEMQKDMVEFINGVKGSVEMITLASNEVKQSAYEMSSVSDRVTQSISQLAEGATQQAESTENGSVRINNIAEMIICIAQDMQASEQLAEAAMGSMSTVKESIQYQEDKMEESKKISSQVGEAVSDLMEKSNEIGKILQVIKGVADQTNLLALNAAIEAARAGEHGKGFAVVSEEIRKLAEQSGESSKQITEIISDVQRGIENTVKQIEKSGQLSLEQEKALNQTIQVIEVISDKVESITSKVKAVSGATESLTEDSKEAEDMIATIASISAETAAGTEEASASVEEQNTLIQLIAECSSELYNIADGLKNSLDNY
jgi:methyl-accepting chemotaxis protein